MVTARRLRLRCGCAGAGRGPGRLERGALLQRLEEQVQATMAAMEREAGARQESEQSMWKMLGDMESTLMFEIQEEKAQRERNEEGFMSLLEETCARIERNFSL